MQTLAKKPLSRLIVYFAVALCLGGWIHGAATGLSGAGTNLEPPGGGIGSLNTSTYINVLKSAFCCNPSSPDTPASFDDDGYPIATLTNTQSFPVEWPDELTDGSTQWVFKAYGTRLVKFGFRFNIVTSPVVTSGTCTVINTGGVFAVTTTGSPCRVTFFPFHPGNASMGFFSGAFYGVGGTGDIAMMRVSDEAKYDAYVAGCRTPDCFYTPEYIAAQKNLNPRFVRMMKQIMTYTGNSSNMNIWENRKQLSNFGWNGSGFLSRNWAGLSSGTDQYITTTKPPADAGTLVNNYTVQTQLTNPTTAAIRFTGTANNGGKVQLTGVTNTATLTPNQIVQVTNINGTSEANNHQTVFTVDGASTVTLNVAFAHAFTGCSGNGCWIGTQTLTITGTAYGAKLIVCMDGSSALGDNNCPDPFSTPVAANTNATLIYNSTTDNFEYWGTGITSFIPIEVMVANANASSSGLWVTFPHYTDSTFWTNSCAYARDNLINDFWGEWDNEVWNFQPNLSWVNVMAGKLNFAQGSQSFYGLKTAQLHTACRAAWTTTRPRPTYHGTLGYSWGFPVNGARFDGTELTPNTNSALCTYIGGVFTASCSINPGFNTVPNTPIYLSDSFTYAPYFGGANLSSSDNATGYSLGNLGQQAFIQNLVNLQIAGDLTSLATAYALMDADFRQGTFNTQTATLSGANTFSVPGTNYNQGTTTDTVVFTGTPFGGVTPNIPYYVKNVVGQTFQISATCTFTQGGFCPGGAAGATVTGISGGPGTVGKLPNSANLMALAANVYPYWEGFIAAYDAGRIANGLPKLTIDSYEGGFSVPAMGLDITSQTNNCNALSITPNAATCISAMTALLLGYKNYTTPNYGRALILSHFNQFAGKEAGYFNFGTVPHSRYPNQFLTFGGSSWAMFPGSAYSAPWQFVNGFRAYTFP